MSEIDNIKDSITLVNKSLMRNSFDLPADTFALQSITREYEQDKDDTELVSHNAQRLKTVVPPKEKYELQNFALKDRFKTEHAVDIQLPPRII